MKHIFKVHSYITIAGAYKFIKIKKIPLKSCVFLYYRDAKNFFWEMSDHVFREDIGYAKYMFAFTSKIPEYLGKKVVVSGISFFRFKFNSIVEYSESVNGGIAMVQLGIKPEKMQKVFLKWFKRSLEDDHNLRNFHEVKSNGGNK